MADLFAVLAADHDRIFALAGRLTGASALPPDEPAQRKAVADELVIVRPKLRLKLTGGEADRLGAEAQQAERLAPTRPHPHLPPDLRLLAAMAPALALLDRARNTVIRRL